MSIALVLILIFNSALCVWQAKLSHKEKELTVVSWVMMLYISIFIAITLVQNDYNDSSYTGTSHSLDNEMNLHIGTYVLISNVALAFGYKLCRSFFKIKAPINGYIISAKNPMTKILIPIYYVFLAIGVPLFYMTSSGMEYTDFVNFSGSNWGLVLMYAAASLICILFMQGRNIPVVLIVLIFIYFAISLTVRSFYIISLFPIIIISYLNGNIQSATNIKNTSNKKLWITITVLIATFIFISDKRELTEIFPESGLVKLMFIVIGNISAGAGYTGFDSVAHFLYGAIAPVSQYIGISPPASEDVQEYFAVLIDGYHYVQDFHHYPALWYSDSYSSFGWLGVLFGFAWGVILYAAERMIRFNTVSFSVFLPAYIWVLYLIMRGAIGNSLLSISRPLYINIILYTLVILIVMNSSARNRVKDIFYK